MNFEPKDQKNELEELFEKINAFQSVDAVINSSKKTIENIESSKNDSPVDEAVFDAVKNQSQVYNEVDGREKSAIRRLIDEEEDDNDEEDEPHPHSAIYDDFQEDIEDFESEEDRDEIYRDLKNTVGKMAVKTIAFLLIGLFSLVLFYIGNKYNGTFFGGRAIWFQLTLLAVDLLCGFLSFGIFMQGLAHLLRFKADTDTLLALLFISLCTVRLVSIFNSDLNAFNIYLEPILAFSLYFNVSSKKKIASNIKNNFKSISTSSDKLTAGIQQNCEVKNELILETGEGGEVAFVRKTGLVSQFIDKSYCDYEYDRRIYRYLFVTILLVLAGTIALFQLSDWKIAILFPATAFSLGIPLFSRLYYASSIFKIGKKIRKNGGILTSAETAKGIDDVDMLVIREEEFFEKDSVLLQGVKALGDVQIDTLIMYIAALYNSVGTPFKDLFLKMIDQKSVDLPRVDDDLYYGGRGYSCYIESKVLLIGNLQLMEQFNVSFPDRFKKLRLKHCHFSVYVAYDGVPAGIFIASFEPNVRMQKAVALSAASQLSIGLITRNFLVNKELLQTLFPSVDFRFFHLISENIGVQCRPHLERFEKRSEPIASVKGIQGVVSCVVGARKLLMALKINHFIRLVYPIFGIGLMFFIALAGYSNDTSAQIFMFQGIWTTLVYLICTFCK